MPTPEWPTRTLMRPVSSARRSSSAVPNGRLSTTNRTPERLVRGDELVRPGQVGFGQAQQRLEPGVERGDQEPVDQPWPRRRVGKRRHDHELVGVRDDDPLGRIVVLRRPAQHRRPRLDAHDPGQRAGLAGHVADQADPVADHDTVTAELARLHRGDRPVTDPAAVPAAVDAGHERLDRVLMGRPSPGARPGTLAGPDPHVVFIESGVADYPAQGACLQHLLP